jgi:arylsulfatase
MPVHGVSLSPTFADPAATLARGPQYFEMLGHRGIWKDGWKAVTHHRAKTPFDEDRWELYHLDDDFSEYEDLVAREPEKLKELVDLWWVEAETHGVLPLDDRSAMVLMRAFMRPGLPSSRRRFVYYPPISHLVADACPPCARGWTMTARIDHPDGPADGALIARGSPNSGFALYVKEGRPTFDYNYFHDHLRIAAAAPLPAGLHEVEVHVERTAEGGGEVELRVDGQPVAAGSIPKLLYIVSFSGMDLGRSPSPVCDDYQAPFAYPGQIAQVTFEVPDTPPRGEVRAQVRAEATRQ